MRPMMFADVESLHALLGEIANCDLTGQGEHTAVVIAVGVPVEQITCTRSIEDGEPFGVAPFAHVDHALEHGSTLPG